MKNESKITNQNTARLAYIYSRVSKSIQAQNGQGISRQIERGKKFVEDLNARAGNSGQKYTYEVANEMIVDEGLSAYLGRNTDENAGLGAFLQAAKEGEIPPHSLLVVEAVDRISRLDPNQSRMIFLELAKHKIDVAIQRFNLVVYHDRKADLGSDLLLTVGFHLAYMESQQKSERIRATFDKKREKERAGGARRTSICPPWMKLSTCKTRFELIPARAELLKRIFKMRINEKRGSTSVAKQLNREGLLNFNGRPWSSKLVEKYWKMQQCLGVFQPQTDDYSTGKRRKIPLGNPIADYYPCVISKSEFSQVQASFAMYEKGAKSHNCKNLFAGILKCSVCGGTLSFAQSNRGQPKLRCRNYLDERGCTQGQKGSLNYRPVELLLIDSFECIDYTKLYGSRSTNSDAKTLAGIEFEINERTKKIGELRKQLKKMNNTDAIAMIATGLDSTCIEVESLKQQQAILLKAQSTPDMSQVTGLDFSKEVDRRKYNSFISSFVEYVVVSENDCIVTFKGNLGSVQLYLDDRLERLRERGYKFGKDIIESKFQKHQEHDMKKVIQVDLKELADKTNQLFSQLTRAAIPTDSDYLSSVKFSFNAQLNAGLCPSKKNITSIMLRNGLLDKSA
ncbi:recombinase family protein [Vibrio sp. 99-70-13A1]|uniref:recombinase family protein n=1 Tax=Vibrio sp. 99-70-13A1 TaxID=2607601 RepID=UPI001493C340|nr:recombinase family protein [Vibrio sp. 99-70-13A1]NOH98909.1 recombinase family protein [Vibrio sp. 99-70-13A1]